MKSYLTRSVFAALASVVITCAASALTINDTRYLGNFTPAQPSGTTDERENTQNLIYLYNDSASFNATLNGRTFTETTNATPAIPKPAPDLTANGVQEQFNQSFNFNTDGATYILVKYSNTVGHVWYTAGVSSVSFPDLGTGLGLSHITRFGATPRVPDGGSTIALLGLGLALVAIARRKLA